MRMKKLKFVVFLGIALLATNEIQASAYSIDPDVICVSEKTIVKTVKEGFSKAQIIGRVEKKVISGEEVEEEVQDSFARKLGRGFYFVNFTGPGPDFIAIEAIKGQIASAKLVRADDVVCAYKLYDGDKNELGELRVRSSWF